MVKYIRVKERRDMSSNSKKQSQKQKTGVNKTTTDLLPMRHTLSHIMAAAILELYGKKTKLRFGIGPAIDTGF